MATAYIGPGQNAIILLLHFSSESFFLSSSSSSLIKKLSETVVRPEGGPGWGVAGNDTHAHGFYF